MRALIVGTLMLLSFCLQAQEQSLYQSFVYQHSGNELPYRVLYPKHFDPHKRYPLVLFLHGAGERGNDNTLQLTHGAAMFAEDKVRNHYPAIVIFPQVPKEQYWANVAVDRSIQPLGLAFSAAPAPTPVMAATIALMEDWAARPYVDDKRIYVGGLSMGGMGTLELLYHKPNMFAAAIVICGAGDAGLTKAYRKGIPVWLFHGEQDEVVSPAYTQVMSDAIIDAGGQVKVSWYAEVGHNSWTRAFAEPELLPWLFSQALPTN
ncbi:dienelactone hydrolase family protein [Bowmanella yangjiangensis]|uniref:Prolyl oligopeptidase family serine peptidase n=1 Tax=Bowmanella yangjiangensis TaxID=2811230 RepID=A0ABS3CYV1_9ALTE|nr:dienelactone hydrolase family protein [Bowmanella yangjiangensis]MBN7822302.1 prolyl oligopeptidase family serine peptidase [Bowmanella yangjiangensis]